MCSTENLDLELIEVNERKVSKLFNWKLLKKANQLDVVNSVKSKRIEGFLETLQKKKNFTEIV